MRTYAWVAVAVVVAGSTACSTGTRARFAATAAAVAREADALPPPPPLPPARVVKSPVVAAPRALSVDETGPDVGSPDAEPLALTASATVPLRPVNATCPVMVGMPVDPACTTTWHGCCIAFCDAAARTRWESSPDVFATNLPPTLSATPIAPPVPGAQLVSASAAARTAPFAKATTAAVAPKAAPAPLAPIASKPVSIEPEHVHGPLDLLGEGEEGECKDGSCRLPVPPR